MNDNLKVGVFLMDKNYIIQPSYSKALATILDTNELEGKKFSYFLQHKVNDCLVLVNLLSPSYPPFK
jgi:hypothetical protein